MERVGEGRMAEPALEEGWSVKDVLAHISSWEKIGMALVRKNTPVEPPPQGVTRPSTDLINQKIYESNRDRSLADVLAYAERSHAELLALVETLSDEALNTALGVDDATVEAMDVDGPTAGQVISGNSDQHYREHADQIARWLGD